MTSNIKRWNGTTWITVADFDTITSRLDVLETFNTALTTTGLTGANAEMGAREAPYQAQARFGHKDVGNNLHGYLASADGSLEINVATGKSLSLFDHTNGLIGTAAAGKWNVGGMGIGASPPYGASYTSLWRAGAEGSGDYGLLLTPTETLLNTPTGGTIELRRGNSTLLSIGTDNYVRGGIYRATGNVDIGNNSIYFVTHGGGWYMQDTWIRSTGDHGVWLGGGWYGGDGGITIGRGGVTDTNYRADFNSNCHVWGSLLVGGTTTSGYQGRTERAGSDGNWTAAHYLAYGTAGSNWTNIAMHTPGYAPQWGLAPGDGEALLSRNSINSGWAGCKALSFSTMSTATIKKNIRTLRPQREREHVFHDYFVDEVPLPNVMALRPVAYRRKVPNLKIVAAPGYEEYSPDDDDSWESVPDDNPSFKAQGDREHLGLVAEDVARVLPSAVQYTSDGSPSGIDYAQVTVALLDHVQELTATVETLRYRITELENA